MTISYDNVKMWTIHTKTTEYNPKTEKHKDLKHPIITEKVHVSDMDAYGLEEMYELIKFAVARDPYHKINVSFTAREDY
tara:strand:+ start:349 stop:585 length:237 start_codon:yes stop_codon:yes gene_type:complete